MAAQAEALHQAAADVLRRSCRGEGTRQVLYSVNVPPAVKSQLQAIVLGSQNNESLIWAVARDCGFMLNVHPDLLEPDDRHLLVVLYEALLGSRRVRGTSAVVQLVKQHKALLQQQLASHRKSGKAVNHQEKIKLPRYVRVNTLKTSMEEAIKHFEIRGWKVGKDGVGREAGSNLLNPPKGVVVKDPQVPNLLVFPAGTSLHNDSLVDSGAVILQDRSSCLSAAALAPIPSDAVIADACAAPGNKTSHAASLLAMARQGEADGRVLAFERDPKREKMLRRQMQKFGFGQIVKVRGRDFAVAIDEALGGASSAEADMLRQVTHVVVDPSCSGSGLVAQYHGTAGGVDTGEGKPETREHASEASEYQSAGNLEVAGLAAEQEKLVLAAMSLPEVRVVVYSTCSVHRQENEDVVEKVLAKAPAGFKLAKALPSWPHRGLPAAGQAIAPFVVRATHERDSTNGFFVARFERNLTAPQPAHAASSAAAAVPAKRRAPHTASTPAESKADIGSQDVSEPAQEAGPKPKKAKLSKGPVGAAAGGRNKADKAYLEYRPTAPATRPAAIYRAHQQAERAKTPARAPSTPKPAPPAPFAGAIDVD
jgi:putative methyltransferase